MIDLSLLLGMIVGSVLVGVVEKIVELRGKRNEGKNEYKRNIFNYRIKR